MTDGTTITGTGLNGVKRVVTFKVAPVDVEPDRTKKAKLDDAFKGISSYWQCTCPNVDELKTRGRFGVRTEKEVDEFVRREQAKYFETPEFKHFWKDDDSNQLLGSSLKYHYEMGRCNQAELVQSPSINAIIGLIFHAYATHMPIILKPDDFWLLISLAVSQFLSLSENAEKYRHVFVQHDGKKTLEVRTVVNDRKQIDPKQWEMFVIEIAAQIQASTKGNISELITAKFSTTGAVEATVSQIVLMDAMKNYFAYRLMRFICGIPFVSLEGKMTDYLSIVQRIEELLKILPDFEWYLTRVKRHMEKILESYQGHPDVAWWQRMIFIPTPVAFDAETYGRNFDPNIHLSEEQQRLPNTMTFHDLRNLRGWISDFFPFRNRTGNERPSENRESEGPLGGFAQPLVTMTPFTVVDEITKTEYPMKLAGGFVGVAKEKNDRDDVALRPAIGWAVYHVEQ